MVVVSPSDSSERIPQTARRLSRTLRFTAVLTAVCLLARWTDCPWGLTPVGRAVLTAVVTLLCYMVARRTPTDLDGWGRKLLATCSVALLLALAVVLRSWYLVLALLAAATLLVCRASLVRAKRVAALVALVTLGALLIVVSVVLGGLGSEHHSGVRSPNGVWEASAEVLNPGAMGPTVMTVSLSPSWFPLVAKRVYRGEARWASNDEPNVRWSADGVLLVGDEAVGSGTTR